MTEDTPTPEKISQAFRDLKVAAAELNAVSDELGKPVSAIDLALKRLNLGVSAWVKVRGGDSPDGEDYWYLELGYTKLRSTWGIAVRERHGSYLDESVSGDTWLFSEAPRAFRLEAVDKLPELLAKLIEDANETTKKLRDKIGKAQQIAAALSEPRFSSRDAARALAQRQRK